MATDGNQARQYSESLHSKFPHPLGTKARILLSSVFGPYAQDDKFGSRLINPMELYHNQVTRLQGPFSLRMFHRSWGLMLMQANVSAPCTLLDFPTLDRFIDEIRNRRYDIIGISSITANILKVKHMCDLVRRLQPDATIVVGGHIAGISDLHSRLDADWIVREEGVQWFRRFLGEDPEQLIRHPVIPTRVGTRSMGITVKEKPDETAVTILPSVGCPLGCNFCSTSSLFGGKGKWVNFYDSGDELFDILCRLEELRGTQSFFVMDENFLLYRKRALRLLELMEKHDKAWIFYVFSSANAIRSYTMEQLIALGISWVWVGLECENSRYGKLHGIDTMELVRELQSHGIRVLGSTIIGLEHHTPENIDEAIEYAVRHKTDFHQFMLYMPLPGTPLYREFESKGLILDETQCSLPDSHGQYRFNYRHAHIPAGMETEMLLKAFRCDFEVNGPSLLRVLRTTLAGRRRYKNHPNPRIRRRFREEIRGMVPSFSAVAGAAERYYRHNQLLHGSFVELIEQIKAEFGWSSGLVAFLGGKYVLGKIRREEKRLARGWTYEPPTFYEVNEAVPAEESVGISRCSFITPGIERLHGVESAGIMEEVGCV
ncbi:MAG: radical SAM protein [Acidobacteria bacterium]|nr:radical SAM protein [Acidobacteriota bacterium]